jgi:hypothetical protein
MLIFYVAAYALNIKYFKSIALLKIAIFPESKRRNRLRDKAFSRRWDKLI